MSGEPLDSFTPPPDGFVDSGEAVTIEGWPGAYPPADTALTQGGFATELLDARAALEEALRAQGPRRNRPLTAEELAEELNIQGVGLGQASEWGTGRVPPGSPALVVHLAHPRTAAQVVELLVDRMDVRAAASDDVDVVPVVTGIFEPNSYTARWRPAPGGVSVGHVFLNSYGTMGCLATGRTPPRNQRALILSNNHVLALNNTAGLGDCVVQQADGDGGTCPADQVAVLERFVPLKFDGSVNFVDAATAWAWPDRVHPRQLYVGTSGPTFYSVANVPTAASPGMAVGKSGRSSGFTIGTVKEVGVAGWVMYNAGASWAFFSGQIAINGNPLFSQTGDSGAVIWFNDLQRHPVGLLFAGGGTGVRTLANNIHNVELALEIALMT